MTSEELADEVMAAVLAVQGRILGVGQEQYSQGDQQKFEWMSIKEIVQYAREEVEDGIAYNVMLRWKLNRLDAAIDAAFVGYATPPAPAEKPEQARMVVTPPPMQQQPTPIHDAAWAAFVPQAITHPPRNF
ncbi:hypothetical protein [Acrocarpospora sp. B8E8]|uniref:hypothetical protein n=1 Tax=Acrocarpospora sp. B8E8 TaxID=3153572 RepID=UPI00325F6301